MKSFIIILLFQFLILIVVSQPVNKLTDNDTDITNYGVHRYPRTLISFPPCKMNQYFDKEKGFCLNVLGGGKALYINNTSCGTNVLKPHCFNPRYYYICKKNKTILAQCSQNKHFEVHLQKCILIYHGKNTPNKTNSNSCQKVGIFPIPNDCHQFYTCTVYGHRMKQNFYICPKNMAFDTKTEMCKPSSTCKESRLSSTCLFSSEKEDMTLEEANMFLRLDKKEKSLMCETIFTSDEEIMTTERNYNNDGIKSTTISYNKPSVSQFTEPSDRKFITTTIERASGTSHSINTVASEIYTTAMYSPTNEEITYTTEQNLPTEIKKNGEENLESSTSKESYKQEHNGKTINNNVQSTDAMKTFPTEPTILDDTTSRETKIEKQLGIKIKTHPNESPNFENQYSTTTAEFNDATHYWYISHSTSATEDLNEPLTTEEQTTDLSLTTINGSFDKEEHTKINSNDQSSEIPNITQPNIEISTSTIATENLNEPIATEEDGAHLPLTTINGNLDEEEHTKINSNDQSSEIPNFTQPKIEISTSTIATENLNEPIATEEYVAHLPLTTSNGNLDEEEHTKINSNDESSEIPNITQPNIDIPNSTPATDDLNKSLTTEEQLTDLSPTTINGSLNKVDHTKINNLASEILNTTQPNIEILDSTPAIKDLNEPTPIEEEITDLPSTTINGNVDEKEHTKINSNDQSSEIPHITEPNIEISTSTIATENLNEPIATEEYVTDLPSTTINGNLDEEKHTKINSNDQSSGIPNITQPNIEISTSTIATENLNEPIATEEYVAHLPLTTINGNLNEVEHTKINLNDLSSEILNTTQPNIEILDSTPAIKDLNEPITTEEQITNLPSTRINVNLDEEERTKINSNDPFSEIPHITQPNVEISTSSIATETLNEPITTEEQITNLPSTRINVNLDEEEHTKINSNDPFSEIPHITQPNVEISTSIPAAKDLNELTAIEEEITDLPSTTTNSNLDENEHTKINSNDQSSEIPNITQPNIDIPNSTPVTENLNELATQKEIMDLPSATINDNPDIEKPEINLNDSSSNILNTPQPNIEISTSTRVTDNLNELATQKEIMDLPSATINDNPDIEKPEINLNDSSSNILNTPQPNIEISNNTAITEDLNEPIATEEHITDLPSTTINGNPDVEISEINLNDSSLDILNTPQPNIEIPNNIPKTIKFNESIEEENSDFISTNNDSEVKKEKKTDINLNDPLSEILITGIPNIEMEHSIVTTMEVTEQSTFKIESSDIISEIPSNTLTSIKENDIHTIINLNDSIEITTPSLQKHVMNREETFMKILNNKRTENNISAETVTDAVASSILENNNNFENNIAPISVDSASYSGMIPENKIEEPISIPITDRIALNKNEENNTPSIESNIIKTNSPIEINTKYTATSINKNLDNIGNEKLILSSDTNINEADKSISQTNKLTTSFQDLIAKCRNHMSAETTTQSTKSNPTNEKYSDPFHMQSHSLVSDKKNADKQNKIFVEEDSLSKRIYSGKMISKNFILPITSAVLNFIDKFECYLKNTLIKIFH
ncbi:myb-like protein U [Apis dorsata]|uniref:myb-like protein U n=1 Tax=Apis dorsata TaxID=7462 RepID=UPI0012937694|nr:myb-like protein U [Apis dorsata]